jgi:hypothetical protein
MLGVLTRGCAAELLAPPVNVLRLSLHPGGLAPRIRNLGQWRAHLLEQVHRRATRTGDARLADLAEELQGYPGNDVSAVAAPLDVVLPLVLEHDERKLSLFSIEARVGTATDVTVDELSIETFYPADAETAEALRSSA